jgi:hypothetical protein
VAKMRFAKYKRCWKNLVSGSSGRFIEASTGFMPEQVTFSALPISWLGWRDNEVCGWNYGTETVGDM